MPDRDRNTPRARRAAEHSCAARCAAVLLFLALLATGCATSTPRLDPNVSPFIHAGPHRVTTYDMAWYDLARKRRVPARIYVPDGPGPFPVILFSHGLGNSREGYAYLARHWTSYGYVTVLPEHVGENRVINNYGLWKFYRTGFDRRHLRRPPLDLQFALDQLHRDDALPPVLRGKLDLAHVGVAGHSLGAYAALAIAGLTVRATGQPPTGYRDPRVSAAIVMSMSEEFPRESYATVAIPVMHLTGTNDWSVLYGTTPHKRKIPFQSIPRDDQYLVVIRGANHASFSNEESRRDGAAHDVIRISTVLFWDAYLKRDESALAQLSQLDLLLDDAAEVQTRTRKLKID